MTTQRLAVTIVFLAASAMAAADATAEPRVRMEAPELRFLREGEVPKVCRVKGHAYACTDFPTEQLTAACAARADGWAIEAEARIVPVMYLSQSKWMKHEAVHLAHLERMVGDYVGNLERVRFETEGSCADAAFAAQANFRVRMNGFRKLSNRAYR